MSPVQVVAGDSAPPLKWNCTLLDDASAPFDELDLEDAPKAAAKPDERTASKAAKPAKSDAPGSRGRRRRNS